MLRAKTYFGLKGTEPCELVSGFSALLPPANFVCEGYVFTCVCLSTGGMHGKGGMHGRGHVWQGCVHGRGHA